MDETNNKKNAEDRKLDELLSSARTQKRGDQFWDEYLTGVMGSVREESSRSLFSTPMLRRLLVPAVIAVIAVFTVMKSGLFTNGDAGESMYTTTIDFVIEEHDYVVSQNMFDPTPFYAVEEIAFDDIVDQQGIRN